MSAIRGPRTRSENTVQQRDATLPGGDLDQNVLAGYAAVALALILDPSGRPLFRRCTARSATRSPPLAQTWHSKIEIRDQYRK